MIQEVDPLEDLYTDAMLRKKLPPPRRIADPSMRNALDAAAKKMRELYTKAENWERRRGLALIDKSSKTIIGYFSEYIHRFVPSTRKLVRETQVMLVDATEEVEGYLGTGLQQQREGWNAEHFMTLPVLLDELLVETPSAELHVYTRLGAVLRVELIHDTQFACASGRVILQFPAGTNIWEACSTDTKAAVRRGI